MPPSAAATWGQRTGIDDCTTPLEEAETLGLTEVAATMRKLTG